MDFAQLQQKYLGQVFDFNHDFTADQTDLICQYLYDAHALNITRPVNAVDFWESPPSELSQGFFKIQNSPTNPSDIVVHINGVGLATGVQSGSEVELLSQDGVVQLQVIDKSTIIGLIRYTGSTPIAQPEPVVAPEPEPEPEPPKPYKAPTGGLKVNLHLETIYIKTPIATYGSPIAASSHTKPKDKKLQPGSHQTDLVKMGMKRLVTPDANDETWINPGDNVVAKVEVPTIIPEKKPTPKQKLDGTIEAESNYQDFVTAEGKLQEKYYTAKEGGAFVIDFKTGNTRKMPGGAHIWLAGITGVGGMGYGIATKCLERDPPVWIGVRLGDLYEDDTFSKHTTIEERKALRRLTWSDHLTLKKARLSKLIQDIRSI